MIARRPIPAVSVPEADAQRIRLLDYIALRGRPWMCDCFTAGELSDVRHDLLCDAIKELEQAGKIRTVGGRLERLT